jgi:hypothetical protein
VTSDRPRRHVRGLRRGSGIARPPNAGGQVSKHWTFKVVVSLVAAAGINTPGGPVPGSVGHRLATLVLTGKFVSHGMVRGMIKSTYRRSDHPIYTYGHSMGACKRDPQVLGDGFWGAVR